MCCKAGLFIGGALLGATVALLVAPESGEQLRKRIRKAIKRAGVKLCDSEEELEAIVDELAEEIASAK